MKKTTNNFETVKFNVNSTKINKGRYTMEFGTIKSTIKNTDHFLNVFERMIGEDKWFPLVCIKIEDNVCYYDASNIKVGDILREGAVDKYNFLEGNATITNYYLVTKVENGVIEMVKTSSVNTLNNMTAENKEEEYSTKGLIETVAFGMNNNTIKNTEDYYCLFEVMIGKNKWQPLNKKDDAYDITGIGIGNILREGGIDSKGNAIITNYYIVTKIENNTIEMVEGSSVKALNKSIELYGIDRLAEMD